MDLILSPLCPTIITAEDPLVISNPFPNVSMQLKGIHLFLVHDILANNIYMSMDDNWIIYNFTMNEFDHVYA